MSTTLTTNNPMQEYDLVLFQSTVAKLFFSINVCAIKSPVPIKKPENLKSELIFSSSFNNLFCNLIVFSN